MISHAHALISVLISDSRERKSIRSNTGGWQNELLLSKHNPSHKPTMMMDAILHLNLNNKHLILLIWSPSRCFICRVVFLFACCWWNLLSLTILGIPSKAVWPGGLLMLCKHVLHLKKTCYSQQKSEWHHIKIRHLFIRGFISGLKSDLKSPNV